MLSYATDRFDCPLKGDKHISLCSGGHDYQKLKDTLLCCSQCFGYQHFLKNMPSTWVVTPAVPAVPAIPAVAANPATVPPVLAVAAIPAIAAILQSIVYSNPIKVLDIYSDKLLDIAQRNASLIWGNESFTNQNPKEIEELTAANGNLTTGGRINPAVKKIVQQRILSKVLAHQTLALLTKEVRQVIEQQSDLYTWKDPTGTKDDKMDGLTIIAHIH